MERKERERRRGGRKVTEREREEGGGHAEYSTLMYQIDVEHIDVCVSVCMCECVSLCVYVQHHQPLYPQI